MYIAEWPSMHIPHWPIYSEKSYGYLNMEKILQAYCVVESQKTGSPWQMFTSGRVTQTVQSLVCTCQRMGMRAPPGRCCDFRRLPGVGQSHRRRAARPSLSECAECFAPSKWPIPLAAEVVGSAILLELYTNFSTQTSVVDKLKLLDKQVNARIQTWYHRRHNFQICRICVEVLFRAQRDGLSVPRSGRETRWRSLLLLFIFRHRIILWLDRWLLSGKLCYFAIMEENYREHKMEEDVSRTIA